LKYIIILCIVAVCFAEPVIDTTKTAKSTEGGALLTIYGSGFEVGYTYCDWQDWGSRRAIVESATKIRCIIPKGLLQKTQILKIGVQGENSMKYSNEHELTISNDGIQASLSKRSASVTSISPTIGPQGTSIDIYGRFSTTGTIRCKFTNPTIGSIYYGLVTSRSSSYILCVVPNLSSVGYHQLSVSDDNGSTWGFASSKFYFTISQSVIPFISTTNINLEVKIPLFISGTNFDLNIQCKLITAYDNPQDPFIGIPLTTNYYSGISACVSLPKNSTMSISKGYYLCCSNDGTSWSTKVSVAIIPYINYVYQLIVTSSTSIIYFNGYGLSILGNPTCKFCIGNGSAVKYTSMFSQSSTQGYCHNPYFNNTARIQLYISNDGLHYSSSYVNLIYSPGFKSGSTYILIAIALGVGAFVLLIIGSIVAACYMKSKSRQQRVNQEIVSPLENNSIELQEVSQQPQMGQYYYPAQPINQIPSFGYGNNPIIYTSLAVNPQSPNVNPQSFVPQPVNFIYQPYPVAQSPNFIFSPQAQTQVQIPQQSNSSPLINLSEQNNDFQNPISTSSITTVPINTLDYPVINVRTQDNQQK
jgi:hypothetical protein